MALALLAAGPLNGVESAPSNDVGMWKGSSQLQIGRESVAGLLENAHKRFKFVSPRVVVL